MHHHSYPNSTRAQAPPPGQDSSSSGSREVNNAVNDVPLSGRLDFQGGQFAGDFFQEGPQFFSTPHALVSQTQSVFPHPLETLLPGNPSQVYGGTQAREAASNNVTGTNFWESGDQHPILYEQPKQVSHYSEKIEEVGVRVAGNPPTAFKFPPPPPGVRSTPNEQGIYDYVWKLDKVDIKNDSGGDLRVILYLKKVQSQAA